MRSDRAVDLGLVREKTDRQKDQEFMDNQRAEYRRRSEQQGHTDNVASQDSPDWAGAKT